MSTLYQLTADLEGLLSCLRHSDDDGEVRAALEACATEIELKAENYLPVLDEMESHEKVLAEKAKQFADAARRLKTRREMLKARLLDAMESAGILSVENTRHGLKALVQQSPPSVVVEDEDALPKDCFRYSWTVDKKEIAARLKAGKEVPGARLNQTNHLRIKVG